MEEPPPEVTEPVATPRPAPAGRRLALLSLTALGVVYGDIGTSPLYALRECFTEYGLPISRDAVFGVLSLIFWSLVLVVSIKYLLYVLRADNKGEGGILALMALVRHRGMSARASMAAVGLGLFGAALLYGDGMITPAISVLSAVEGLKVAAPHLDRYVLPVTAAILTGLFFVQRKGTAKVGLTFGPAILVWFLVIGTLGAVSVVRDPSVLAAVHPAHALRFLAGRGAVGYMVLGAVFLVITGSEALYADLGHFSAQPIRISWFLVAAPCLILNYFGQGALILRDPSAVSNPFYHLAPGWMLTPLIVLAAAATVIASQAVISGVFSLTRQAVQLGYLPRVEILHTSDEEAGQIYIPLANWAIWAATLTLVFTFKSSGALAAAYGVAVSLTMVLTTLLAYPVTRRLWRWPAAAALAVSVVFLTVDLAFFGANISKILDGGWVPLAISAAVITLFTTWKRGQAILYEKERRESLPLRLFIEDVERSGIQRIPGHAVILCSDLDVTPSALLHNIKHNKVLHEKVSILTMVGTGTPKHPDEDRLTVEKLPHGFQRLIARYGFMEYPDLLAVLYQANEQGLDVDPLMATYIISRKSLVPAMYTELSRWRFHLFRLMYRNSVRPALFFRLPPGRVIEIGKQLQV